MSISRTVNDAWLAPFELGTTLRDTETFRLAVDRSGEVAAQILARDSRTVALVTPEVAEYTGVGRRSTRRGCVPPSTPPGSP